MMPCACLPIRRLATVVLYGLKIALHADNAGVDQSFAERGFGGGAIDFETKTRVLIFTDSTGGTGRGAIHGTLRAQCVCA